MDTAVVIGKISERSSPTEYPACLCKSLRDGGWVFSCIVLRSGLELINSCRVGGWRKNRCCQAYLGKTWRQCC